MRITLSAGSRIPPGSKLGPVKHEGLRARWGLVASDRYALVRGLPEEVLTSPLRSRSVVHIAMAVAWGPE